MIIRINHNPTILELELLTWKQLHRMVTSHTDQYTKRLSSINLHDHTHQAKPKQLGVVPAPSNYPSAMIFGLDQDSIEEFD